MRFKIIILPMRKLASATAPRVMKRGLLLFSAVPVVGTAMSSLEFSALGSVEISDLAGSELSAIVVVSGWVAVGATGVAWVVTTGVEV